LAKKKPKTMHPLTGPIEVDGKLVAEDGGEVTPALQKIYEYDQQSKQGSKEVFFGDEGEVEQPLQEIKQAPLTKTQTSIIADTFEVPKYCDKCYLQDKCPQFGRGSTCYYRINVNINDQNSLVELLKTLLEIQGERVLFGRFIEQMEGGYNDRNLSEEMERLMRLVGVFKDILSESKDEISIKMKGTEAVKSVGILSQIFGDGGKDD